MKQIKHIKTLGAAIALTSSLCATSLPVNAATYSLTGSFVMFDSTSAQVGVTDNTLTGSFDDTDLSSMTINSTQAFFGFSWVAKNLNIVQTPGFQSIPTIQQPVNIEGQVNTGQWFVHMLFDWGFEPAPTSCGKGSCDIDVINVWDVDYGTDASITLTSTDVDITGLGGTNGILGAPMVDGPFIGFHANFNVTLTPPFNTDLEVNQSGGVVSIVDATAGIVTITDGTTGASGLSYNWNNGITDASIIALAAGSETTDTLTFNPGTLSPGDYVVSLAVTATSPAATIRADTSFSIPSITLLAQDFDGDGVNDNDPLEGFGDVDGDGIPNYLDHAGYTDSSVLQMSINGDTNSARVMRSSAGKLIVGATAQKKYNSAGESAACYNDNTGNCHGPVVYISDLSTDNKVIDSCVGDCFDFKVAGLSDGETVNIVIPLSAEIPDNAVYRKYDGANWGGFKIDNINNVSSAAASSTGPVTCPAPGDAAYREGLNTGDTCIQLTMNEGGPNDADGQVNGTLVDPGGIATTNQFDVEDAGAIDRVGASGLWLFAMLPVLIGMRRFNT